MFNQAIGPDAATHHPEPNLVKPMATEKEWADSMASCVRISVKNSNNWNERRLAILRQHYRRVFSGHPPVFTHGDFSPGNIILREDGSKGAVIIDWQYAGWYPSCWEFGLSMILHGYGDDWLEWLPRILDEFIPESGWIMNHRVCVRDFF